MEIDLLSFLKLLRKRLWVILLFVLVATVLVALFTRYYVQPVYEASVKMIVNKANEREGSPNLDLESVNVNIKLIDTYKEVIKSTAIMDVVVNRLPEYKLNSTDLIKNVKISSVNETQVMTLSIEQPSYEQAATIVNTISAVFKQQIPSIMNIDNVLILNEAKLTDKVPMSKPNLQLNIAVGFIISFVIITAIVVLIEHLDDTIRSEEDIEDVLGVPTLAMVARLNRKDVKSKTKRSKVGESVNASLH